jgi:hypothetical protein
MWTRRWTSTGTSSSSRRSVIYMSRTNDGSSSTGSPRSGPKRAAHARSSRCSRRSARQPLC